MMGTSCQQYWALQAKPLSEITEPVPSPITSGVSFYPSSIGVDEVCDTGNRVQNTMGSKV